jgi:hypothetical protein
MRVEYFVIWLKSCDTTTILEVYRIKWFLKPLNYNINDNIVI